MSAPKTDVLPITPWVNHISFQIGGAKLYFFRSHVKLSHTFLSCVSPLLWHLKLEWPIFAPAKKNSMRKFIIFLFILALFQINRSEAQSEGIDTISYSIGMSLGYRLKNQGASDLKYSELLKGIQDVLDNNKILLERNYSDSINYIYYQNQRDRMFTKEKEAGANFLAKNGQRPEVTTTESGLQYEVLTSAEGEKPTATSTVTVHYVGKLLNGDMFDSSVDRGEPISFPLNRVIPGWTEGLQYMSTGAKYRFFIPENLAYGSRGAGGSIPPYSALIFDVELLSFK